MSVQSALAFIARVRRDDALRHAVAALGDEGSLARVVEIAAGAGFELTAEELRAAHAHDWSMRWMREHSRRSGGG